MGSTCTLVELTSIVYTSLLRCKCERIITVCWDCPHKYMEIICAVYRPRKSPMNHKFLMIFDKYLGYTIEVSYLHFEVYHAFSFRKASIYFQFIQYVFVSKRICRHLYYHISSLDSKNSPKSIIKLPILMSISIFELEANYLFLP